MHSAFFYNLPIDKYPYGVYNHNCKIPTGGILKGFE